MYSSSLAMNSQRSETQRLSASPSNMLSIGRPLTPRKSNSEDVDFMIGDRVYVGNKPGVIAYLGEVKFASGDFAGVVLDESVGKNDGSMKGTRYFQCEPLKGVFVRTSKLVKNMTGPVSTSTRASPRSANGLSTPTTPTRPSSTKPSSARSRSSGSTSSAPSSATEDKQSSPVVETVCSSAECQAKTGEQMQRLQKEYEGLMSGTRQKFEEFQQHISKMEKENAELHKTIEEQKAKVEDLQFQLEEEVLSKEDVMQELVNVKNNNQTDKSSIGSNNDLRVAELQQQLGESIQANSSLREELDEVKVQLSDIEFQLAENESEKDNELKEKKKLEDQIAKLESQSASKVSTTNQSDNSNFTQSLTLLSQQLADKTSQLEISQRNSSKLEAKVTHLQERIKVIESQHNQDKQLFSQSQDSLINQHKIDIETLRDDHTKALHRLQKEHTDQVANLDKEHNHSIQQMNTQHENKLSSVQRQLDKLLTDYTKLSKVEPCSQCVTYADHLDQLHRHAAEAEASREEQVQRLTTQVSNLTSERQLLNNTIDAKSQLASKLKQQVSDTQQQLTIWQREVKGQVESNKLHSEQDLEKLRVELESSQSLLVKLERKLSLSESENSKLHSRVNSLSNELRHVKQKAVAASPRDNNSCDGTYRDTSDFLFNELKHQVEVMELNMLKATEEDQRLKEENEQLRTELSQIRYEMGGRRNSRRNSQPRMFCDTCGAFDQHPTFQCSRHRPTSTSSQSNVMYSPAKPPHCNICNVEGHWTADCTVDE